MKTIVRMLLPVLLLAVVTITSCKKEINEPVATGENSLTARPDDHGHLTQTKTFSSGIVTRWLDMQLDMLRVPLAPNTGSQTPERCQAYCGISLYEAVVQGMPAYQSLAGQLTALPAMPQTEPGKAYHWAASANAALAEMNRRLFPTTSQALKNKMNFIEDSARAVYATEVEPATLQRSIAFGREVATRVANWAATDGSANVNPAYVAPTGPGLWVPTAPTPAVNPYAYQRRLLVPGVATGTALQPPPAYSTDPASPFYAMVKDVYDKSLVLTPNQIAMAVYFRDAPGYPGGGHFIALLSQVLAKVKPSLDVAALAYAKIGISQSDATIILFTNKYQYNLVRPVTYIQTVMGHPSWQTVIPTPNHPEFPSGHATTNSSIMPMFTDVFGENFEMTLHTYDYLNLPPRSYHSFTEMGKEMADSRVYGGLHYQATCDKSIVQGNRIAQNILNTLHFLK